MAANGEKAGTDLVKTEHSYQTALWLLQAILEADLGSRDEREPARGLGSDGSMPMSAEERNLVEQRELTASASVFQTGSFSVVARAVERRLIVCRTAQEQQQQ